MTTGNKDLISYTIACLGTLVGLFGLQALIATSTDIGWHADQREAAMNPDVQAARAAEQQALGNLDQAIEKVAKGERPAAPEASTDVGALSGWVHGKRFAPAQPFAEPAPATTVEALPAGEVPATDTPAPAPAAPGPAPVAPKPAPAAAPAPAPAAAAAPAAHPHH